MKPPGIRLKLTLWFVGALLVILALYSAWIGFLLWRNLSEALEHHLDEDYLVAVQLLECRDGAIVWHGVPERDPGYQGGVRRWVEVWSSQGLQLFLRGSPEVAAIQRLLPPPVAQEGAYVVRTPAGRLRAISRSVDLNGSMVIVRVARTEQTEWVDLQPTLLALVLGIPLAVGAAGLGGYVMARRALAPVREMADRARHISADQLDARLPIQNPDDELGQLAAVFNDTFARLERSFVSLHRFTADASHELRTPLTALRSVGEVALTAPRSADAYRDVIGSMLEEASRLGNLVDGLLLLSRADGSRQLLHREPLDLVAKVKRVVGQLSVLAEEKNQAISVESPPSLVVDADSAVCQHALVNVLDNAIKYGPPHSCITVTLCRVGDSAIIDIADEGPGIPVEHRDRIFDRFYRADAARDRKVGGSGLGLSIARWAVDLHGGSLTLVTATTRGACFRITLPLP